MRHDNSVASRIQYAFARLAHWVDSVKLALLSVTFYARVAAAIAAVSSTSAAIVASASS